MKNSMIKVQHKFKSIVKQNKSQKEAHDFNIETYCIPYSFKL